MRNLKSVHLINAEELLKTQLEGFLRTNIPSINSTKRPRLYIKLKEASEKIKKTQIKGKLKLALSLIYSMALVYFLTILLF